MASETTELLPTNSHSQAFSATSTQFRIQYYTIACLQVATCFVLILGQTGCLFNYNWTVSIGLQESKSEIGQVMVQMNRAFAAADTILYLPLVISSVYGLFRKMKWSLICTAASAGIHSYWPLFSAFGFMFLSNSKEYTYHPNAGVWAFLALFFVYGIAILSFLYSNWGVLLSVMK